MTKEQFESRFGIFGVRAVKYKGRYVNGKWQPPYYGYDRRAANRVRCGVLAYINTWKPNRLDLEAQLRLHDWRLKNNTTQQSRQIGIVIALENAGYKRADIKAMLCAVYPNIGKRKRRADDLTS
jgi:hypothetical protein